MTFEEFTAAVTEGLGPDGQRTGAGTSGLDIFRRRAIKNAMTDLQRFIPSLRTHTDENIAYGTLTANGRCSQGTLAAGAKPQEFWIVEVADTTKRYLLESYPWANRYNLINGDVPDGLYVYTIAPDGRTYLIHPGLTTATKLNLVRQGIKTDWADADVLSDSWDNAVSECVAEYVKSRIVRQYDKDSAARSDRHYNDYMRLRRAVFIDLKEATD